MENGEESLWKGNEICDEVTVCVCVSQRVLYKFVVEKGEERNKVRKLQLTEQWENNEVFPN